MAASFRETLKEVLQDAPEASASHIEALREDGRPVPQGSGIVVAAVTVAAKLAK